MHLRPAQIDDAAAISSLIQLLSREFVLNPDGAGAELFWESVSEKTESAYIASERFSYILAVQGNELAGFIAMRDISHLFHLFVSPKFQGQGLARRLWSEAKSRAIASGFPGGFTVNSSISAVPVYERFGFARNGDVVQAHGISFLPMRWAPSHAHG